MEDSKPIARRSAALSRTEMTIFPSSVNETSPRSRAESRFGVKRRPLYGLSRSAFVETLQGLRCEARRSLGSRHAVTAQPPHSASNRSRNRPWPRRAKTSARRSVSVRAVASGSWATISRASMSLSGSGWVARLARGLGRRGAERQPPPTHHTTPCASSRSRSSTLKLGASCRRKSRNARACRYRPTGR